MDNDTYDTYNSSITMTAEQVDIFAQAMALMLAPIADGDRTEPVYITAKEYGLFAMGLMLLDAFVPTNIVLGDQIRAARERLSSGALRGDSWQQENKDG